MDARIIVIAGKTSKRVVALKLPAVVGRSREADITVAHPMISRRHCELFERDGLLMVRDLASLNGTFMDGKRFMVAPLMPGNQFTIGPIAFCAEYEFQGNSKSVPPIEYGAATQDFNLASAAPVTEMIDPELQTAGHSSNLPPVDMPWADHSEQSLPPMPADAFELSAPPPMIWPAEPVPNVQAALPSGSNHPLRKLSSPAEQVPVAKMPLNVAAPFAPGNPVAPQPFGAAPGHSSPRQAEPPDDPRWGNSESPWDDPAADHVHRQHPAAKKPGPESPEEDIGDFLEGLQ